MTNPTIFASMYDAAGPSSMAHGDQQQMQNASSLIPVYVRIVPKDIWLRMHIDQRATIGSVKDAVLDKAKLAPHDPSMYPHFYDEARSAMSRQGASIHEVKSLPKAFLARMPKRSIDDLLRSERETNTANLFAYSKATAPATTHHGKTSGASASRRTPNVKSVATSAQARAILGGDAGLGGRGSLGFVGSMSHRDEANHSDNAQPFSSPTSRHEFATASQTNTPDPRGTWTDAPAASSSSSPSPSALKRTSNARSTLDHTSSPPSVPAHHTTFWNDSVASPTEPVPDASAHIWPDKSSNVNHDQSHRLIDNKEQESRLESALDDERDAENWQGRLTGNEEAKRLEQAAIMQFQAATAGVQGSESQAGPTSQLRVSSSFGSSGGTQSSASATTQSDQNEQGHSGTGLSGSENDADGLPVSQSRRLSFQSSSSSNISLDGLDEDNSTFELVDSVKGKGTDRSAGKKERSQNLTDTQSARNAAGTFTTRSGSPIRNRAGGERARSGTLMPTEAQRRAIAQATSHGEVVTQVGSSTPSTINTSSSSDMHVPDIEVLQLPRAAQQGQTATEAASPASSLSRQFSQSLSVSGGLRSFNEEQALTSTQMRSTTPVNFGVSEGAASSASSHGNYNYGVHRRLAGIYTDEISSWRDAQHSQARFFSIHSYSNGHALEDWRTVAALRIRPFELLEVQFAEAHLKVHLPRIGEATNLVPRKHLQKSERDEESASFTHGLPSVRDANPALDSTYLEPYSEFWCYIFKDGSGSSRTQRAGLGLWKLRWICLHSNRIFVFRFKPPRFVFDEAMSIWNLDALDSILSERADGATRPHLLPLAEQCQDILTLTFRRTKSSSAAAANNVSDESTPAAGQPSVSMRFITQVDYTAFFRSCARAHQRVASRKSDVPALASMVFEWRRKALARATIAGMGGTVMPGKAARRGGRNALARKRLRPPGVSRDFDNADRWSSASETESVQTDTPDEEAFVYADALTLNAQQEVIATPMPPFTPTPSLASTSYFGDISSAYAQRSTSGRRPNTAMSSASASSHDHLVASDISALGPSRSESMRLSDSQGRRRGFSLAAIHSGSPSALQASHADSARRGGASASHKLQHASSMRFLSPSGVGLGVMEESASTSPMHHRSSDQYRISSSTSTSPLRSSAAVKGRRESHPVGSVYDGFDSSKPGSNKTTLYNGRPATSGAAAASDGDAELDVKGSEQVMPSRVTPLGRFSATSEEPEEIVLRSPNEDDDSPAARAINSFLAQRSASMSSGLHRDRSDPVSGVTDTSRHSSARQMQDEQRYSFVESVQRPRSSQYGLHDVAATPRQA